MPRKPIPPGTWLVIVLVTLAIVSAVVAAKYRRESPRTPPVPAVRPDTP